MNSLSRTSSSDSLTPSVTTESSDFQHSDHPVKKTDGENGHKISIPDPAVKTSQGNKIQAAYHAACAFFPSVVQFGARVIGLIGLANKEVVSSRSDLITNLYRGNDKIAGLLDLKIKALKAGKTDLATAYEQAINAFSEGKEQLGDIYQKAVNVIAGGNEALGSIYQKAADALKKQAEMEECSIEAKKQKSTFEELTSDQSENKPNKLLIQNADDGKNACQKEWEAYAKASYFHQAIFSARMAQAEAAEAKDNDKASQLEKEASNYEQKAAISEKQADACSEQAFIAETNITNIRKGLVKPTK